MTAPVRILTVRQPWAAAIAHADKRVENRTWSTSYRGWLLIHAGKLADRSHGPLATHVTHGLQLDLGAVVALAKLTGCHPDDGTCTPWSERGAFHHVLDEVTALPLPIPWRGSQGLRTAPADLVERVAEQLPGVVW